jgi:hypothetical protein
MLGGYIPVVCCALDPMGVDWNPKAQVTLEVLASPGASRVAYINVLWLGEAFLLMLTQ